MVQGAKRLPAHFYRSDSGKEPVREWLKSLDLADRKILGVLVAYRYAVGPIARQRLVGSEEQLAAWPDRPRYVLGCR